MQFIPSGVYFARCKVRGKAIRASLKTTVFTTAKLKLLDKLKELRKPPGGSRHLRRGARALPGRQFVWAIEPRQLLGIAAVGLHPVGSALGNLRGRHDLAAQSLVFLMPVNT